MTLRRRLAAVAVTACVQQRAISYQPAPCALGAHLHHRLRSTDTMTLQVPSTRRSTIGDRAFPGLPDTSDLRQFGPKTLRT